MTRLWCRLFGHYWDYSYGLGVVRCLRCGAKHPGGRKRHADA